MRKAPNSIIYLKGVITGKDFFPNFVGTHLNGVKSNLKLIYYKSMKFYHISVLLLATLFALSVNPGYSQEIKPSDNLQNNENNLVQDSKQEKKVRKNTLLLSISNPLLISSNFQIIGYERILPNNQSFTLNIGMFSLPKFSESLADSLGLNTDYKDRGFHFSTDYRFYLKKENKFDAPRGVYLAPYYTYNHLNRQNSWDVEGNIDEVYTNLKLNIHTIGAELGYQFVFWDRVALDLILLGPGFGFYSVKAEIGTTLDPDKERELFQKLNEILADRIPGYNKIIEPGEFRKDGTLNTQGVGFRYVVRVGYRF
jgi:hypothetical protein